MPSIVSNLLLSALLLVCCQAAAAAEPAGYQLGTGDRIRVTVFGHEDLSGEFEVTGTGDVSLPLIDEVHAKGLTVSELETSIEDALQPDYLIHPRVSVEVLAYRPFYIVGEVATPGSYPYVNGMTVLNAVAVAGGFNYRARKGRIVISRGEGQGAHEISADMDTLVLPGDIIKVPERFF